MCELTLYLLVSVFVLIWEVLFCSSGGFGRFSGGVEAKGSASSSDVKEVAKEEMLDEVCVLRCTLDSYSLRARVLRARPFF